MHWSVSVDVNCLVFIIYVFALRLLRTRHIDHIRQCCVAFQRYLQAVEECLRIDNPDRKSAYACWKAEIMVFQITGDMKLFRSATIYGIHV